jgi:hypothetical protein
VVEITEINILSNTGTEKMLLALSRGCCDASSRINGPAFAAAAGVVAGGAYTFPVRARFIPPPLPSPLASRPAPAAPSLPPSPLQTLYVNKDDTIRVELWSSAVMSAYLGAVEMPAAACNGKVCSITLLGGKGPNAHSLIVGVLEASAAAKTLRVELKMRATLEGALEEGAAKAAPAGGGTAEAKPACTAHAGGGGGEAKHEGGAARAGGAKAERAAAKPEGGATHAGGAAPKPQPK